MKTDNRNFICSCFETSLLAIIIGFLAVMTAKAENNFDFDMLNGLFTPTQSERFFQADRENFEREVEIFNHPEHYLSDDLLQIHPELVEQMDRYKQSENFIPDNSQYELYRDCK